MAELLVIAPHRLDRSVWRRQLLGNPTDGIWRPHDLGDGSASVIVLGFEGVVIKGGASASRTQLQVTGRDSEALLLTIRG
ncbi:MAG TPA: hypothetical protein VEJ87_15420 [Acidimicrobiales bacterium]|nr:hypothetical protein [Acidimicrobiales bacterium]